MELVPSASASSLLNSGSRGDSVLSVFPSDISPVSISKCPQREGGHGLYLFKCTTTSIPFRNLSFM